MPHFGPECVLWHSTPGDCRWSFAYVTAAGDPIEGGIPISVTIPEVPEASPLAFIVVLFCAPPGEPDATHPFQPDIEGIHVVGSPELGPFWIDAFDVQHRGHHFSDSTSLMVIFPLAGTAGGHVDALVGTFSLNFATGFAVVSGNGEAIAMIVDPMVTNPGDPTIALMVWDNPGVPENHTGSGVDVNLEVSELILGVFAGEPAFLVNDGLVIGMAMSTSGGSSLTAGPSDGWTEIVQDHQTGYIGTGSFRAPLPPSFGSLAIYDNATAPVNRFMTWHNETSSPAWWTAAALLRYPAGVTGIGRGRSTVQVIG